LPLKSLKQAVSEVFGDRLFQALVAIIYVFYYSLVFEASRVTSNRLTLGMGVHFSDKSLSI
jgi:hypothetical protein